jgi:hypothetical protein
VGKLPTVAGIEGKSPATVEIVYQVTAKPIGGGGGQANPVE